MYTHQWRLLSGLAVVGAVAAGVSGCNPIAAVTEQGVEQAIEDATGGNVDIDTGSGASVPADFPSDVPLIDGKVSSSVSLGTGAEQSWNIVFSVSDANAAYADAVSKLTNAGYTEVAKVESADGSFASYTNSAWSVTVSSAPAIGSEQAVVSYLVTANTLQ